MVATILLNSVLSNSVKTYIPALSDDNLRVNVVVLLQQHHKFTTTTFQRSEAKQ